MWGSGDSTLVITPTGKKVLIDGGEAEQNILVPYLLARKIRTLDYVIVSHFDSDHSGGVREVIEKLKVKKLVISKQAEKSEECSKIIEIAKQSKTEIIIVEEGQKLNIDKKISFSILWPEGANLINENALNNNSIVAKLIYGNFQMLFTGDIEQIAEEKIVEKYGDNLKSAILKVAHHGSNTSSIESFINAVEPEIALIGVRQKQYIWTSK